MILGYARVSTDGQVLDRQLDMLKDHGVEEVFSEKFTGTKANRPEMDKLKLRARAGDTIIVESLSRLGRSTKDLLNLLAEFQEKGIKVISLKENIDTSTPTGKLVTTLLAAICEFERDTTVQRTKEGLKAARARGRKGGRPSKDEKDIEKAIVLYDSRRYSVKEITKETGVSKSVLYKHLAERKME